MEPPVPKLTDPTFEPLPGREAPEWVGAHPDTKVPPHVRQRIFLAHRGRCGLTGRKIAAGEAWDLDHRKALALGGEHREANLWPVLCKPHRAKSAAEVSQLAKDARVRGKFLGIAPPSPTPMPCGRRSEWKRPIRGRAVPRHLN